MVKGLVWETKEYGFYFMSLCNFTMSFSYTLGNLGTALALEVSICGQDYLLPPHSILSSFRTVRSSILLEVTVTVVKMYTSQPALQIRMAVHWIGFLGNLLNMG